MILMSKIVTEVCNNGFWSLTPADIASKDKELLYLLHVTYTVGEAGSRGSSSPESHWQWKSMLKFWPRGAERALLITSWGGQITAIVVHDSANETLHLGRGHYSRIGWLECADGRKPRFSK